MVTQLSSRVEYEIGLILDDADALQKIEELNEELEQLRNNTVTVNVNTSQANTSLQQGGTSAIFMANQLTTLTERVGRFTGLGALFSEAVRAMGRAANRTTAQLIALGGSAAELTSLQKAGLKATVAWAAGLGALGLAMAATTLQFSKFARELSLTSDFTGIATEDLYGLDRALRRTLGQGLDLGAVQGFTHHLETMTRALKFGELPALKTQEALGALGATVYTAGHIGMPELIRRFQALPEHMQTTARSADTFGESLGRTVIMATRAGIDISAAMDMAQLPEGHIERLRAFNQRMLEFKTASGEAWRGFAMNALPILEAVTGAMERFNKFASENPGLIKGIAGAITASLVVFAGWIAVTKAAAAAQAALLALQMGSAALMGNWAGVAAAAAILAVAGYAGYKIATGFGGGSGDTEEQYKLATAEGVATGIKDSDLTSFLDKRVCELLDANLFPTTGGAGGAGTGAAPPGVVMSGGLPHGYMVGELESEDEVNTTRAAAALAAVKSGKFTLSTEPGDPSRLINPPTAFEQKFGSVGEFLAPLGDNFKQNLKTLFTEGIEIEPVNLDLGNLNQQFYEWSQDNVMDPLDGVAKGIIEGGKTLGSALQSAAQSILPENQRGKQPNSEVKPTATPTPPPATATPTIPPKLPHFEPGQAIPGRGAFTPGSSIRGGLVTPTPGTPLEPSGDMSPFTSFEFPELNTQVVPTIAQNQSEMAPPAIEVIIPQSNPFDAFEPAPDAGSQIPTSSSMTESTVNNYYEDHRVTNIYLQGGNSEEALDWAMRDVARQEQGARY